MFPVVISMAKIAAISLIGGTSINIRLMIVEIQAPTKRKKSQQGGNKMKKQKILNV